MGISGAQQHRHRLRLFLSPPRRISKTPFPLLNITLTLASLLFLFPAVAGDLYSLVYKGCANQTLSGNSAAYVQPLAALSSALTARAASAKFYKTTTTSSAGGGRPLFGLFQCRGDLPPSDCSACVGRVLFMWTSLCGTTAAAARVQLNGCYALYQSSGFPQVSGTQMLYKTCGSGRGGGGFEVKRDTAFAQLQSGIAGGQGFYATSYASVYAMAQCEGDLSAGDCSECVAQAVQKSEVECGAAASGQVYLDKCYISYNYYANGVPHGDNSSGGGGVFEPHLASADSNRHNVGFRLTPTSFSPISNATVSTTIGTLIATSSSTRRDSPARHGASIPGSPKAYGTVDRGSASLSIRGIQQTIVVDPPLLYSARI
ncbi:hypothetical protein BHE74_00018830 [Ensete ventricosum]|nr:hypothetical protein BHE74_00018830 [Ensete ventricosum]